MIKLYGNPYSRSNRVRWTLEETGIDYEEDEVELGKEGTRSSTFLQLNRNGHVPVLDDDGLVLFESVPIALYIAKKYGDGTLYPSDVEAEARVWQWSVWAMTELEANMEKAALHCTWFPEAQRDPAAAAKFQSEVRRCLSMLEDQLDGAGFLVGKAFSVADLIVSEVLTGLPHAKVELAENGLKNYLGRNLTRQAAKRAFAADILEPLV